jgi:hypothetical protein
MADITKCSTPDCPLAGSCYRKTAVSNLYRQAWGNFPLYGSHCSFYIPTETEKWVTIDVTPL